MTRGAATAAASWWAGAADGALRGTRQSRMAATSSLSKPKSGTCSGASRQESALRRAQKRSAFSATIGTSSSPQISQAQAVSSCSRTAGILRVAVSNIGWASRSGRRLLGHEFAATVTCAQLRTCSPLDRHRCLVRARSGVLRQRPLSQHAHDDRRRTGAGRSPDRGRSHVLLRPGALTRCASSAATFPTLASSITPTGAHTTRPTHSKPDCAAAGIKRSMIRKANRWDNAVAERSFSTLETELLLISHFISITYPRLLGLERPGCAHRRPMSALLCDEEFVTPAPPSVRLRVCLRSAGRQPTGSSRGTSQAKPVSEVGCRGDV